MRAPKKHWTLEPKPCWPPWPVSLCLGSYEVGRFLMGEVPLCGVTCNQGKPNTEAQPDWASVFGVSVFGLAACLPLVGNVLTPCWQRDPLYRGA